MQLAIALGIAIALVGATILLHYEVLRGTSGLIPKLSIPLRSRILVVIAAVFLAHLLEVALYAAAYFLMQDVLGLGVVAGALGGGAPDFFYFSISSFTTPGVGDVYAHGPLRLVAGVEALNGFILIGWSASFTYLSMEKFWGQHRSPLAARNARKRVGRVSTDWPELTSRPEP